MPAPVSFTVRPPGSAPYRPSPLGSGARGPPSRRLFEDNRDEDDDEDDGHYNVRRSQKPKDERIEGFGNGRIIGYVANSHNEHKHALIFIDSGDKPEGPLIIPALPNKDWRASSSNRRVPSYRPDSRTPTESAETHERVGDEPQRSGLRTIVKTEVQADDGEAAVKVERTEEYETPASLNGTSGEGIEVKKEPLTLEEQALQAILQGDVPTETEEERLRRELVIDMGGNKSLSEEDALKRDIEALPEEVRNLPCGYRARMLTIRPQSTLDDYAAIPVSAFGEAMARGMGWNPSAQGTKIHEPKLRPALLGLGATALETPVPPSRPGSSTGKRPPKPSKRESMKYNLSGALVRRGENGGSVTPSSERSSRHSTESDGKRRRDDDDGRESKRRDDGYRDRDRERDRRDDRARDRVYETEEERARRKAKERERRDRYDDRDRYGDRDRKDRDRRDERERRSYTDRGDDRDKRDREGDRDRRRDR